MSVLEGDLTNATGAAALFIDWFAARDSEVGPWSAQAPLGTGRGTVIQPQRLARGLQSARSVQLPRILITMGSPRAVITPIHLAIKACLAAAIGSALA